ncbi:DUF473 domain-containing protein [Geoglobus acetivorans]|uniref:DUF473 domain-containing protein n=1 Tax=Geoglobus acetivorans TaxID=565033 RepID=A0A0A7GF53_GEOAI|nr:hypothetical protein GACE_0538 [Geoglobus acetivorans]MBE8540452.1 DUF473 domain-containing protein [Geoglobus acetivorans]
MRCYVISGISRYTIEEVLKGNLRTLELRNVVNISSALNAGIGECVFITTAKNVDLSRGVTGIIAEVERKELTTHTMYYSRNDYFEECEMTAVRLKIRPRGVGRIIQVFRKDILSPVEAEVIQLDHFLAR